MLNTVTIYSFILFIFCNKLLGIIKICFRCDCTSISIRFYCFVFPCTTKNKVHVYFSRKHSVCCLYINSANRLLLGFLLTVVFLLRTLNPQWLFNINIQNIRITFKFCHKQSKKKFTLLHAMQYTNSCKSFWLSFPFRHLVTNVWLFPRFDKTFYKYGYK